MHSIEQDSQQLDPTARIAFVKCLAQLANLDTAAQDVGCDLKRPGGGVWVLERASIGGDGGEKIFCDRLVERQILTLQ